MSDDHTGPDDPLGGHGSVAEEIAALAEALRARRPRTGRQPHGNPDQGSGPAPHPPSIDACGICPLCRLITALHTVSPSAVTAMADLAHQAELTLRTLAVELQRQDKDGSAPAREDIHVDDLGDLDDEDTPPAPTDE